MDEVKKIPALEAAKWYAEQYKFKVLPIHGVVSADGITPSGCTCGNTQCAVPKPNGKFGAGKHPATKNGLSNATSSVSGLGTLWAGRDDLNVGLLTGIESGVFIVDIDGPEGEASWDELVFNNGPIPKTRESITSSGKHILFKYPNRKVFSRVGKLGLGIDVRGEGGYAILPPSRHFSGHVYEWVDYKSPVAAAPKWLLDIVCGDSVKKKYTAPVETSFSDEHEWSIDDVKDILSYIDSDILYDDWVNVGMGLHSSGYPLSIWETWSATGSKYVPGDCLKRWGDFCKSGGVTMGTVVQMAQSMGWKHTSEREVSLIEEHPARAFLEKIGAVEASEVELPPEVAVKGILFDPMKLDGVIGDTVRYMVDTAIKKQPELALYNTLAALGAVFGRRYKSPWDTRTNIYIVGIAGTGSGKDHSRRVIKKIFEKAGVLNYIGSDDIRSSAGILQEVTQSPSVMMMIDEFGETLQSVTGETSAAHLKGTGKVLTALWSSSNSSYNAGTYADAKAENMYIKEPNLCIYGTTTLDTYAAGINKSGIQSGNLNRFMVLPVSVNIPERSDPCDSPVPGRIISQWEMLSAANVGKESSTMGNLSQFNNVNITPKMKTVNWDKVKPRIDEIGKFEDAKLKKDPLMGPLWGRYCENVIKIAMILAIARDTINPTIESTDMDFAEALVTTSVEFLSKVADDNMYENAYDKDKNDVLSCITNHSKNGILRKKLVSAMGHLKIKDIDAIVSALVDEGKVEVLAKKTGGAPIRTYKRTK